MLLQYKWHNKLTSVARARYAILIVGLPTERGNTLECRRNFFMGCRERFHPLPPSLRKREASSMCYICYIANLSLLLLAL